MSAGEDPVAWLRAQVEARKAVAEEALLGFPLTPCVPDPEIPGERWYASYHEVTQRMPWTDREANRPRAIPVADCGAANVYPARHIALNDPQDTITRCEAELAILDRCEPLLPREDEGCAEGRDDDEIMRDEALAELADDVLALLADGYRHRPGWSEHWACPACRVAWRDLPAGHSRAIPMEGGPWTCRDITPVSPAGVMAGPALRLRHVELPVRPGTRLTVWAPAGHDLLGAEPLAAGQGFTINVDGFAEDQGGGRWRTVLRSWETTPDGTTLEVEVEGRYPQGV